MKPSILAIDIGFGNTKATWSHRTLAGKAEAWSEIIFKSVCPLALDDDIAPGQATSNLDRVAVSVAGQAYYVGPKADREGGLRALHPDYINTPTHEALLLGAWHYMFKETGIVSPSVDMLVLGLPVSGFSANKKVLKEIGSRVRRVPVPMPMRSRLGKAYVDVSAKQVVVLPQPLGGLRLAAQSALELADDGVISMVIDPGYLTFDWLLSDGMAPHYELCGSFQGGVSQLINAVAKRLSQDHGIESADFAMIESALAKGELLLDLKRIDMTPYRKLAGQQAQDMVAQWLMRFNPYKAGVSRIFVCGGGAGFYIDALKARLPHIRMDVMPEGVMSNCRGYFLTGQDMFAD
ncbi:ParM/StbA family protein [Polaromonas naphthalenivorans]|uniref:Uncharacterized protein n=1 Tax=Polaromonas naphthalenivorans (strain CJ2) TaxID=365044 RepID=A1VVE9_POLNA|nr:hypothetical protein [Polaromonas naphthalenivorans]ABM39627.1 hypothetical protein Pnap_4345 [Polaromonas naphthalenivorans CJ2]